MLELYEAVYAFVDLGLQLAFLRIQTSVYLVQVLNLGLLGCFLLVCRLKPSVDAVQVVYNCKNDRSIENLGVPRHVI